MNNEQCTDKKKQIKDKNHYMYNSGNNIYIYLISVLVLKAFFIFHRQYKIRKNTKINQIF